MTVTSLFYSTVVCYVHRKKVLNNLTSFKKVSFIFAFRFLFISMYISSFIFYMTFQHNLWSIIKQKKSVLYTVSL